MKKIVSLILAGLMSVSLFAIGASADRVVGDPNGVENFTENTSGGNNINVQVNETTHKYAVDLTFSFGDLVLGGMVWNVETMRYDFSGTKPVDTERTITVTNRSDKPVYAYGTVADKDASDYVTVAMKQDVAGASKTNKLEVAAATAGVGANGKATEAPLTVSISSAKWEDVASYYGNKKVAENKDTFVIASVTVTITKEK